MEMDTIREFHLAYPYAFDDENPRKKNIDWLKNLEERFDSMPKQECSEDENSEGSKKTPDNDEICETSQDHLNGFEYYLNGFECGKQYVLKYPEKFNLLPKTE